MLLPLYHGGHVVFGAQCRVFFEQRLDPRPVADYGGMSDDMSKSYPKTDPKTVQRQTQRFLFPQQKNVSFFQASLFRTTRK